MASSAWGTSNPAPSRARRPRRAGWGERSTNGSPGTRRPRPRQAPAWAAFRAGRVGWAWSLQVFGEAEASVAEPLLRVLDDSLACVGVGLLANGPARAP